MTRLTPRAREAEAGSHKKISHRLLPKHRAQDQVAPPGRRPEQALHRACAQFLDLALPPDAIWLHYPSGGYRRPVEARIFKSLGVRAGIPDVLVFHSGKVYGIELKAGSHTLTSIQRDMHRRLEQCGVPCCVATTVDEVADFLEPRIPLRAHLGGRA